MSTFTTVIIGAEFFMVGSNLLNISTIGQESSITQNFVITCS